jgi:hypothetical protein
MGFPSGRAVFLRLAGREGTPVESFLQLVIYQIRDHFTSALADHEVAATSPIMAREMAILASENILTKAEAKP